MNIQVTDATTEFVNLIYECFGLIEADGLGVNCLACIISVTIFIFVIEQA